MDMNVSLSSLYPSSSSKTTNDSQERLLDAGQVHARKAEDTKRAPKALDQAIESLQAYMQSIQRSLDFSIDDSTGIIVVKVIEKATGELIRQLPTEEALELAKNIKEVDSRLFKAKA